MKDYFGKEADRVLTKKLYLFDMDGTIYLENRLFDGVTELFEKILCNGGRYVFITNNSSKSVKDYLKKIRKMGLKATEENFFTSTQAAIELLKEKHAKDKIYAQGTKSFVKELKASGLTIVTKYDPTAKVVIVGNGKSPRVYRETRTDYDLRRYGKIRRIERRNGSVRRSFIYRYRFGNSCECGRRICFVGGSDVGRLRKGDGC